MKRCILGHLACALLLAACGKQPEDVDRAGKASEAMHAQPQHARISPEAAKAVGVEVSEAAAAPLREVLPLYGVIRPNGERVRNVSARFPGVIKTVRVSAGQSVAAGQLLATVESNDSLQTYPVTAPIAGMVTEKSANPGETVGDQPMFVITDLTSVWVELTLFAKDLTRIRVGQSVNVKAVAGGLEGAAKIVWVSSVGESVSQSVSARCLLHNTSRQWKPGLYVSGEVTVAESVVPIAVKTAALQTMGQQLVVFVAAGDGYTTRPVRVGRSDGLATEVLDGLKAGEKYVSANSFVIKAEIEKGPAGGDED